MKIDDWKKLEVFDYIPSEIEKQIIKEKDERDKDD